MIHLNFKVYVKYLWWSILYDKFLSIGEDIIWRPSSLYVQYSSLLCKLCKFFEWNLIRKISCCVIFSLFYHFDCHSLLNNYTSGTLMAMMLRTRIEISWLKCLSLPVSIVCKSRSPDMARSRPLRLFSHSSDRFQTSKYLLGTLCLTNSDQFGDVNGKVSPLHLLISIQFFLSVQVASLLLVS